jgi:hypothetical protein
MTLSKIAQYYNFESRLFRDVIIGNYEWIEAIYTSYWATYFNIESKLFWDVLMGNYEWIEAIIL